MERRKLDQAESGQALVIMVLALVGLIGFAAVALDGGNLYTEQRRAQAAADSAVMAAAYHQMRNPSDNGGLAGVAQANALLNGYDDTTAQTDVVFNRPPTQGAYAGNALFLEVKITQRVPTALAHIVYGQSPIPLTVWAVAQGSSQAPLMDGYALNSLRRNCDGESMISLQGRGGGSSGGTYLYGGGAFTNANCDDALTLSGSGESLITDGSPIAIAAGGGYSGGGIVSPAPTLGAEPVTEDPIASSPAGVTPDQLGLCGPNRTIGAELADTSDGANTIRPGRYPSLQTNGTSFEMAKGIYCLYNGSLDPGNGSVTGNGVMIYLENTPAEVNFAGNGTVRLTAPTKASTGCQDNEDETYGICRYLNIVIYKANGSGQCQNNAEEIKFVGNAQMVVIGLVYAPQSLVRYGGSGNLIMTGQTIAACVKFNGNGRIEIYYDPDLTYVPPPSIELLQ